MADAGIKLETPQAAKLQALIQNELADREWAERSDTVMAEYVTVMLANNKTADQINEELVDLIGSEYDNSFVTWLFDTVANLDAPAVESAPVPEPVAAPAPVELLPATPAAASSRLLSTALSSATSEENKRKRSPGPAALDEQRNKRVAAAAPVPAGPRGNAPTRGGRPPFGGNGQFQQSGSGFRPGPGQFRGPPGPPGFRPNQGFNAAMAAASQGRGNNRETQMMAEMLQAQQAQMMQMQAMMQTMVQMNQGGPQLQTNVRPQRPPKIPAGVKLGAHTMGGTPAPSSTGPIPTKPTDSALCKFSVGCSNPRCPYSHPSPVADELSGVVLSADPCPEGVKCADKDCIKSHVSPAVVHGDKAGQSRMLCKFQNCNNPSCPFRHEDAQGNLVPPPALAHPDRAKKVEEPEVNGKSKSLLDGPLESSAFARPCKFGAACGRADCKFQHPNRSTKSGNKSATFAPNPAAKPFAPKHISERPFAAPVPKAEAAADEEINVEQVV